MYVCRDACDALTRIIPAILESNNGLQIRGVHVLSYTHDCVVDLARDYTAPERVITARVHTARINSGLGSPPPPPRI